MSLTSEPTPYAVDGGLAVYRFGEGEPVFFMPGPHRLQKPGDRSADALIEGLVALGRRVITYDPPGSGRSTRPARLSMAEMHQCADEALAATGIAGPVDALGHSMGGLAMLAYALERPERIRRLILVGTGSGGPAYMKAPGALWNRSHPGFWGIALLGAAHVVCPCLALQTLMLNYIDRHSFHDRRYSRPNSIEWRHWFRRRRGRTDWHSVARKLDYSSRLGEIAAATLVLCGRHDPQYPPAASEQLLAGIPHARGRFFERSGHYPFIEEPEAFWETVGEFLSSCLRRQAP